MLKTFKRAYRFGNACTFEAHVKLNGFRNGARPVFVMFALASNGAGAERRTVQPFAQPIEAQFGLFSSAGHNEARNT